jgi:hypothetical protein
MANALAGSLIVVFDVNFLDPGSGADANAVAFTNNLIAYLAAPVSVAPSIAPGPATGVPTLSEWSMILLGCCLMFVASRKLMSSYTV